MVPAIPRWRVWRRRLLLSAVGLLLVGATVGVMWWLRPQVPMVQPFEAPYLRAIHAAEVAGLNAASNQEAAALQAQLDAMTTERDALQEQLKAAKGQAEQAAMVANTVAAAKPKKATSRRKRIRRRSSRTKKVKRRTPRRSSKTDKSLEGLLNTL
jgi:ATPase subunit of ABC transporter with duplicated ATPase domains